MKSESFTVLHVIETLGPGGAERVLVTLLPELMRQGVTAEVAVQRGAMQLKPDLEAAGIVVHVLPKRHKWNLIACAWDLSRLAKDRGAAVIHAHLYFPTIMTAVARLTRLYRGATFASFHNLAYGGANAETWKLKAYKWIARRLVHRGIDQPQGVSAACAAHYAHHYGLSDVQVLHNAIDMTEVDRVSAAVGDAIVLPGRLVREKGHQDLIDALKALDGPCPPVIFAGDGPLRSQLEANIQAANLPVTMTGLLTHADILDVIASARLVIIPSRYEGFGLTALEAMALGRPVIATTVGGLVEVLGDVGRLVPPADPDALKTAIEGTLKDADWCQHQEQIGKARASAFAVPAIVAKQIALYQRCITAKGLFR